MSTTRASEVLDRWAAWLNLTTSGLHGLMDRIRALSTTGASVVMRVALREGEGFYEDGPIHFDGAFCITVRLDCTIRVRGNNLRVCAGRGFAQNPHQGRDAIRDALRGLAREVTEVSTVARLSTGTGLDFPLEDLEAEARSGQAFAVELSKIADDIQNGDIL